MNMDIIKKEIREILSEYTDLDVSRIGDQDLLFDDWAMTSVVIVQVFVTIQEKYGISMQDEVNMQAPVSIQYIAEIVMEKINRKEEPVLN